jgi:hypothetical protein
MTRTEKPATCVRYATLAPALELNESAHHLEQHPRAIKHYAWSAGAVSRHQRSEHLVRTL